MAGEYFLGMLNYIGTLPTFLAVTVAFVTIFSLIYGRFEVRLRRLRMIRDYVKTFPNTVQSYEDSGVNPSFEFVRSKYSADVDVQIDRTEFNSEMDEQIVQIDATIKATRLFCSRGNLRLVVAAIPYALVVFAGFRLVFHQFLCALDGQSCPSDFWLTIFILGGSPGASTIADNPGLSWVAQNAATVACFAFVGAYASSLRYLVQALSVFDLQAFTFVRQTAVIVITVIVTIAIYRALPNPYLELKALVSDREVLQQVNPGLSFMWMLLALGFGLLPESATQFAFVRLLPILSWIKSTDDRFIEWTRVVPLDAIDGIDYFTRFRLQECGITEVQSLATYNPIMLHIETPFGIYQAIDWIAQAQLCTVVGLDRFLLLRQFNVRTIFDLERVIIPDGSKDSERRGVIDIFDGIYAGVLLSPNMTLRGVQNVSAAKFLITKDGSIQEVDAAEFSAWASGLINADPKSASIAVEHIMRWIGDDLHVRRLRRLWNEISVRLGPDSLELFSTTRIEMQSKVLQSVLQKSTHVK